MTTRDDLLHLPEVVGVADGSINGKACIKVYVRAALENPHATIPPQVDGLATVIEISGDVRASSKLS